MRERVYLVDYATRVGFTIPVWASTEDEAQDIADKLIEDRVVVPSNEVSYMLNSPWAYTEPPEVSRGDCIENTVEEYGMIYNFPCIFNGGEE